MKIKLSTSICLRYDTLDNWRASTRILELGEAAICTLAPFTNVENPEVDNGQHPVLYKIGDGKHTFSQLPWGSALAADVYNWAKETQLAITYNGDGNVVSKIEWDATVNNGKGGLKVTTINVATTEELNELSESVATLETWRANLVEVTDEDIDALFGDDADMKTFTLIIDSHDRYGEVPTSPDWLVNFPIGTKYTFTVPTDATWRDVCDGGKYNIATGGEFAIENGITTLDGSGNVADFVLVSFEGQRSDWFGIQDVYYYSLDEDIIDGHTYRCAYGY